MIGNPEEKRPMEIQLTDKTVLVTGASTGIGHACAVGLAERGARVFAGVRKEKDFQRLAEAHEGVTPLYLDVTRAEQVSAARETIAEAVGESGLHGLVNNAGITVNGPMEFVSDDDLRWQFEVNLFGQFALIRKLLPLIRPAKGRIVNIGSVSGRNAMPIFGPYSASKFALRAASDSLRVELYPQGVFVSLIEPGMIATAIWEKNMGEEEQLRPQLSDEAEALYGEQLDALFNLSRQSARRAAPAEVIVKRVAHALTVKRPRAFYRAGPGSRQVIFLEGLPVRLRDWIIRRLIKSNSKG